MKAILACYLALLFTLQVVFADVFSQLQFMKIESPTNNQNVKAGEKVVIKYAMQPLIYNHVSAGLAKSLKVNFHKRSGNTKQSLIKENIVPNCPITAAQDKFKTYKTTWTVPANTAPGSYAFDFVELVQLRRGQMTASETVKLNVVN
ncbi:uncharacterized protein B0P05DRAFT_568472 [Gilbertella persicaria]|uniref:uncharacterized protein n=1 Tax=Gilbertella persicaria TaxID=101096 RepID=UPI00221F62B0|nr:uncharacterized protein B0P05DRAFT_568472 [Gilbertella persicaria]KAI8092301.1 hypothetical protein B0P05DRAFT_568472 [Gilbertella persicaria]